MGGEATGRVHELGYPALNRGALARPVWIACLTASPMANEGARRGFVPLAGRAITAPTSSTPADLGNILLKLFDELRHPLDEG